MAKADLLTGIVVGALVGAALGILYAPKSGRETREDIEKSLDELADRSRRQYEQARRKLAEWTARVERLESEEVQAP